MDHDQPTAEPPRDERQTSATLLARLRGNEPDAWRTMVRLYGPLVRHWLRLGAAAIDDYEDLSQDVFREASRGLASFRRDRPGDTFRGWLRGITRNVLLRRRKQLSRGPQSAGGTDAWKALEAHADPLAVEPDAAESTHEAEAERTAVYQQVLELARAQFEEKTWQAFYLTAVEARDTDEVARQLGVSPAAVRKYKSRVLQRLRSEYEELLD